MTYCNPNHPFTGLSESRRPDQNEDQSKYSNRCRIGHFGCQQHDLGPIPSYEYWSPTATETLEPRGVRFVCKWMIMTTVVLVTWVNCATYLSNGQSLFQCRERQRIKHLARHNTCPPGLCDSVLHQIKVRDAVCVGVDRDHDAGCNRGHCVNVI